MTTQEILETLHNDYPDCLTADGLDDAIVGVAEGACRETVVVCDYDRCVELLMESDEIDRQTAEETFDFNTVNAFVGDHSPLFLHDWRR